MRAFILAVCAFFAILVIALSVVETLKYRRQLAWTFVPFVLAIALFGWSAAMFFGQSALE